MVHIPFFPRYLGNHAYRLYIGGVPTAVPTVDVAGAQATASNVVNAAQTVAQVANAAASTVLDVKAAWSSPENCIHSKYRLS